MFGFVVYKASLLFQFPCVIYHVTISPFWSAQVECRGERNDFCYSLYFDFLCLYLPIYTIIVEPIGGPSPHLSFY